MPVAFVPLVNGVLLQLVAETSADCSSRKSCANNGQETATFPPEGAMLNRGRGSEL
jgi:hypothetical protein